MNRELSCISAVRLQISMVSQRKYLTNLAPSGHNKYMSKIISPHAKPKPTFIQALENLSSHVHKNKMNIEQNFVFQSFLFEQLLEYLATRDSDLDVEKFINDSAQKLQAKMVPQDVPIKEPKESEVDPIPESSF